MSTTDGAGTRKRRRRNSIKADDILAGAFEVARRGSLDDLSMPILAEHLDVGVTSIYWHFRKKDELLSAMSDLAVDKLVSSMPGAREGQSWQETLFEHFRQAWTIHREDELLCDLVYIRISTLSRGATHRILEMVEAVLEKLTADGFTSEDALKIYNTISLYARGMIMNDRNLRLANAPTIDPSRQRQLTDWSAMPVLLSLVDHYPLSGSTDEDFEFGLKGVISGFEDLPRAQGGTPARSERGARAKATAKRGPSRGKSVDPTG